MAPTRVARALDQLLGEINHNAPARSKASDGALGDAAHAARESDHNPHVIDAGVGVVTARDFTHDPDHGFNAHTFADWLRRRCKAGLEKRVKYLISNRRIASPINQWEWRPYHGDNPHEKHTHVSVLATKNLYDSTASWKWEITVSTPKPPAAAPTTGPGSWPAWKLTPTDVAALGGSAKVGQEVAWSALLRYPPAVARLRREMTAGMGALTALIKQVAAADAASEFSAAELEQVARAGAQLALQDLDDRNRTALADDDTPD